MAVEGRHLTMDASQGLGDENVDPAEEMADRNALFQVIPSERNRRTAPGRSADAPSSLRLLTNPEENGIRPVTSTQPSSSTASVRH
jgi:hypothetical protein